jgi:hypothetical protein
MAAPKIDFKMLIVPAVLYFSKKIDFKDPAIIEMLRNGFFAVVVVVLSTYYYLYTRVNANKTNGAQKIWVPPKAKPALPFGLGPAPEPIKIEDFEATTVQEYETKLIKDGVQAVAMSGGISFLMSLKFSPMALLIQSIMIPVTMSEHLVLRKYLLGATKNADGGALYNELTSAPTAATVAALNAANAAALAAASGSEPVTAEEPRVVELTDEDKDDKKKKDDKKDKKEATEKKAKSTAANEID